MALKSVMEKAINEQIQAEFFSAYLYLSMQAYFEHKSFPGMANWMHVQFQEEQAHGLKFFNYVIDRGGRVELKEIQSPEISWDSPLACFEAIRKHEEYVTDRINNLVELAMNEKDFATYQFLQWFVQEQVEEEANVGQIIENMKRVQDSSEGIYMMDKELATRVFVDPTLAPAQP